MPLELETVEIRVAFVVCKPRMIFSVLFVVDPSPIYRITNQDVCAGLDPEFHRLIVEYRVECSPLAELVRLGLIGPNDNKIAFGSLRMEIPTLANVARGWTPRAHLNAQLLEIINAETRA